MAGFVKLHRCVMDKAIWKNHNLYRVFSWCLMKATWKRYETVVGMTKVSLEPGQFIFGRFEASKELYMKPSTVFDCMQWLKSNNTIDIKSDNKKSVITVINWHTYQSGEDDSDISSDNSSDITPTTSRQQADTNKKVKKIEEDKEITIMFEKFYSEYPRHECRNDAEKAWKKINPSEYDAIFSGLEKYIAYVKGKDKQYIKTPGPWLNSKRWNDEYGQAKQSNSITKEQADKMSMDEYRAFKNGGGVVVG